MAFTYTYSRLDRRKPSLKRKLEKYKIQLLPHSRDFFPPQSDRQKKGHKSLKADWLPNFQGPTRYIGFSPRDSYASYHIRFYCVINCIRKRVINQRVNETFEGENLWRNGGDLQRSNVITTRFHGGKDKPSVVNNFTRPGWMIKPRPESCSVSRRIHSTQWWRLCSKLG